jgi:hypothetical protein
MKEGKNLCKVEKGRERVRGIPYRATKTFYRLTE